MIHFHPPDNPLEGWISLPFRPAWRRRTSYGVACYFCGSVYDETSDSPVPCCEAAHYWSGEQRKRVAKRLIDLAIRGLK